MRHSHIMSKATLFSDGGARGNPGHAGIGYELTIEGKKSITQGEYIGKTTNNQAEYRALLAGIRHAKKAGVTELACYLDSELVVKQLRGQYRVKNIDLKTLYLDVLKAAEQFVSISYHHVPRAKNKTADRMVNEAIDAHLA